jgi:CheY-like chemotaxis protein
MDIRPGSPLHEHLDSIEQATSRMAILCRQVLEMGGMNGVSAASVSLNTLITETIKHLRHAAIPSRIAVKVDLDSSAPLAQISSSSLRLIFSTLMLDAVPRLPEAGASILVASRMVESSTGGRIWQLDITDNCLVRCDSAHQIRVLSGFVETLRATIAHRDLPQGGSLWQLELPLGATITMSASVSSAPRDGPSKGTIMVVDDDESLRTLAQYVVERTGYKAVGARDGAEAITKFREDPGAYRLVLLDVSMPRMSGEETMAILRTIRQEVPVVLITGHEEESLREGEKMGVLGILHKPFSPDQLRATLAKYAI